jgi:hypothetical protein
MKNLIALTIFFTYILYSEPKLYFIEPKNDDVLTERTFKVQFGLEGFGIAPAGYDIPNTGHHHLLINTFLPDDLTQPIPADEHHVHFGLGQTETEITLERGTHTLRLVLGNYLHIPHAEPIVSEEITILVL